MRPITPGLGALGAALQLTASATRRSSWADVKYETVSLVARALHPITSYDMFERIFLLLFKELKLCERRCNNDFRLKLV